ncbi:MAG: nucleoside hydrolase [Patescibacteria group bacterium]
MMHKIIIDTDPGHDDALALMLLIKSGRVNVEAITTVAGNSTIQNVTRNGGYILDLLERRDIPLYSGKEQPLRRNLVSAVVHGESGLAGADTSKTRVSVTKDADLQIAKIIKKSPGNITLLTLGPLTNIARAFLKDPVLSLKVEKMVIMGGAINVAGNKNRVAEFNMFVDPEAADVVFKAKVKKVLIPIDVCNNIPLFISDFEKLKGAILYKPVMNMMREFIKGIEKFEGTKGALVYDAIAAYYLLNENGFLTEPMDIVIETRGEHTFGMTIAEKRIGEKKRYNVDVVTKVDRDCFVKDFISILKK